MNLLSWVNHLCYIKIFEIMGLKNDLFIINLIELANHFVFKFSSFSKLASDGFLHIHGNRAANS